MDLGLHGKVALVTGGSMGIGSALAHSFAREGARVAICARGKDRLDQVARDVMDDTGVEVLPIVADITSNEQSNRFVGTAADHFGRVDILVNNAGDVGGTVGRTPQGHFMAFTDDRWAETFAIKFYGNVHAIRAMIPYLIEQGQGGRIIAVTGNRFKYPRDRMMSVGPVNAALTNLMKSLADDLAPHRILVNCVCPSSVVTHRRVDQNRNTAEREGISVEEAARRRDAEQFLGRSGTPDEVADVVVFLASERAAYVSGTTVFVDGNEQRSAF